MDLGSSARNDGPILSSPEQPLQDRKRKIVNDGKDDDFPSVPNQAPLSTTVAESTAPKPEATAVLQPKLPQPIPGDINPKRTPLFNESTGKYLKPPGRRPHRTEWNEDRGVWAKVGSSSRVFQQNDKDDNDDKDEDDNYLYRFYNDYDANGDFEAQWNKEMCGSEEEHNCDDNSDDDDDYEQSYRTNEPMAVNRAKMKPPCSPSYAAPLLPITRLEQGDDDDELDSTNEAYESCKVKEEEEQHDSKNGQV